MRLRKHTPRRPARSVDNLAGLRVALYAGMFVRDYDGATRTLFELIDSLRRRRAEIGVWSFSSNPDRPPGLSVRS